MFIVANCSEYNSPNISWRYGREWDTLTKLRFIAATLEPYSFAGWFNQEMSDEFWLRVD